MVATDSPVSIAVELATVRTTRSRDDRLVERGLTGVSRFMAATIRSIDAGRTSRHGWAVMSEIPQVELYHEWRCLKRRPGSPATEVMAATDPPGLAEVCEWLDAFLRARTRVAREGRAWRATWPPGGPWS